MKDRWTFIVALFVLIGIDLGIKVVIHANFMDTQFDILPPWFYFKPVYNTHYFYLGSIMGWQVPLWAITILSLLVLFINDVLYESFYQVSKHKGLVNMAFAFSLAGIVCAMASNHLWPGCLDYIYLKPLYVFDLKDVYLNVSLILIICIGILGYKQTNRLTLKRMWIIYLSRFKSSN